MRSGCLHSFGATGVVVPCLAYPPPAATINASKASPAGRRTKPKGKKGLMIAKIAPKELIVSPGSRKVGSPGSGFAL
uniref:Putative secreted protein n=1 Tax=Anopheles triannulatus TaxID=58253 RepID=A0A2M4B4A6_9DIPT